MAHKMVKDLKKGDVVITTVSNNQVCYIGKCTVVDSHKLEQYDPNMVKGTGRITLYKVWYKSENGKLKGTTMEGYAEEDKLVYVPDRPGKLRRLWDVIWSS